MRAVGFARAQGAALKVLHIRSDHPGFSACKRFQVNIYVMGIEVVLVDHCHWAF